MRALFCMSLLTLLVVAVLPWPGTWLALADLTHAPGEYVEFGVTVSDSTWGVCSDADSVMMVRRFKGHYWDRRRLIRQMVKGIPDSLQGYYADTLRADSVLANGTPLLGQYKVLYFAYNACGKGLIGSESYRVSYSAQAAGPVKARIKTFTGQQGAGTMIPGVHVSIYDWAGVHEMWEGVTLPGDSSFTFYCWPNAGSLEVRLWLPGYSFGTPETLVVAAADVDSIFWGSAFDPGTPSSVEYCRVWGYTQHAGGLVGGIKVRARLRGAENVFATPTNPSRIVLRNKISTVSSSDPDSLGYWHLDLIKQKYLNPEAYVEVTVYGKPPETKWVAVPDSSTAFYGFMPDLYE